MADGNCPLALQKVRTRGAPIGNLVSIRGVRDRRYFPSEIEIALTLATESTKWRARGLRLNLSEQPEVALVAATHALAAQIFYVGADAHVVDIQPIKTDLTAHADGIEDTAAGKAWADRHANWARQMPRDVTNLWTFVAELDHDSGMALFAHCVA
jgi:ParB family transcriptional regulator, chromosome partitioning protein